MGDVLLAFSEPESYLKTVFDDKESELQLYLINSCSLLCRTVKESINQSIDK